MNQFCHWCPFRKTWQHILLYLRQPRNPKGQNFLPMAWPSGIQVIKENNEWSCMTFDKHVRQTKCSLYGVMVTGPSARGRRGGGLGQGCIDKPEIQKLSFLSYKWSLFGAFRSSNDFSDRLSRHRFQNIPHPDREKLRMSVMIGLFAEKNEHDNETRKPSVSLQGVKRKQTKERYLKIRR